MSDKPTEPDGLGPYSVGGNPPPELTLTGGTGPYKFSVSGTLPVGIVIDETNGRIYTYPDPTPPGLLWRLIERFSPFK